MAQVGRMVKESIVQELSNVLAEHPDLFVTTVNRLTASEADVLRQKLCASQARLVMVTRRLGRRTVEQLKVPGLVDLLEGSVGLVLPGEDILPAAKLIVDFIKTHEEHLSVRGGLIDGQLLDKSRVEQLASLPPKPVLLAQVVATLESPIADVIFTIERLIGDLAWLAEQAAEMKPLPATEPGYPANGGVGEGSAERRSRRPTEAGTPPTGGVTEGSPDAVGGGTQPTEKQLPKQEEGTPS